MSLSVEEFEQQVLQVMDVEDGARFSWRHFSEILEEEYAIEAGQLHVTDQHGGEGQGDEWYIVVQVGNTDDYFRLNAYYSSYDGIDYSCASLDKVQPYEEMVVKWQAV